MGRNEGTRVNEIHVRGRNSGNAGADIDSFLKLWARGNPTTAPSGRSQLLATDGATPMNVAGKQSCNEEIVSLGGNTSVTTANNLLPANALIKAVVVTPLDDITSITSWSAGDGTTSARFKSGSTKKTIAGGPEVCLTHWTGTVAIVQATAAKVKLLANTGGSGHFHIAVFYESWAGNLA